MVIDKDQNSRILNDELPNKGAVKIIIKKINKHWKKQKLKWDKKRKEEK